jgi:translation initiation factor IF-2
MNPARLGREAKAPVASRADRLRVRKADCERGEMGRIRINDLARELEVKSKAVLEYLVEIGIQDKKSHSSAVEDDLADKVREHFHALGEGEEGERSESPARPLAPKQATPPPHATAEKAAEIHPEVHPLTRSIAEIKAEARRVVGRSSPAPAARPEAVGGKPVVPARHAVVPPSGPAHPLAGVEAPAAKAGAKEVAAKPAEAAALAKPSRGRAQKSPASNQPIYPPAASPKGVLPRPHFPRRAGEPRAMHPTSARPVPGTHPIAAGAPLVGPRPPLGRAGVPSREYPRVSAAPRHVVPEEVPITHKITITEGISVKELSEKLDVRAKDVIKRLLDKGIFATINQTLDSQTATEISRGFGAETDVISYEEEVSHEFEEADRPEDLLPRAPVVTVMGHVDHGKTSLLDAIRETNVTSREAGGITQHIGAYRVEVQDRHIVFLDTPGHEAFTLMRARGAKVTDVVVLVVAADDGVMPQTLEAINHARAAKVPIVVAINKIDKPDAQPERVKKQLADQNLMSESWGGDTVMVEVSAKKHQNLNLLLEMILLVADMQALKANPHRLAAGTVLEAQLDRGRGPVATVLVQNGTLHVGDAFIVGSIYGKVRAMLDHLGQHATAAAPSTPVEVLGLDDVPQAGDRFLAIEDTVKARQISVHRQGKAREAALAKSARLTLEHLHEQLAAGDVKELPLIIKADVQGSVEVLADTLNKLSSEKVKVKVIHAGVGAITETDVLLASASNAVVIGFNVRPERKASDLAQLEQVDIRLHSIIYNVTDEIKKAMAGLLAVTFKETTLGRAEVRDTFRITKVGTVAGCHVQDGKILRDSRVRLLRDSVVVFEGKIRSLRHFKDDVAEVKGGAECGVAIENFNDVKVGDVIESYVRERVSEPVAV